LILPDVEDAILYILHWFYEIKGEHSLTYVEIEAWDRLKSVGVTADEVEALMSIDAEYINSQHGSK
jgi:hypothetical protein